MEIFDPQIATRDQFDDKTKDLEAYSPKCTKAELSKMIDFNNYKQHDKYKNVTSKVAEYYKGSIYSHPDREINLTELKTI